MLDSWPTIIRMKQKSVSFNVTWLAEQCLCILDWRNFDDERVTLLSPEHELVRPEAYVLFYRNRTLPVHFNVPEPLITSIVLPPTSIDIHDESTMDDVKDLLN
jgi:hypothetical protein